MADMKVTLRLSAVDEGTRQVIDQVTGEVRKLSDAQRQHAEASARDRAETNRLQTEMLALARAEAQASAESRRTARDLDGVATSARRATRETGPLADAMRQVRQAIGGIVAFKTVQTLVEMADGYANIQAKLKLAAGAGQDYVAVQAQVYAISQRTATSMDATAQLATKNIKVFQSLGESATQSVQKGLALTQTINKAIQVSGATTEEAKSLVTQLGQALQSGVLRGDEFNSIMENGGRVVQALGQYTGKTAGELRKMAEEGKLTAQLVLAALGSAAKQIDEEYAQLPLTIGRAWTMLRNAMQQYVGQSNEALGATTLVANAMRFLAEHITAVGNVVALVATVFAVRYVAGLAAAAAQTVIMSMAARAVAVEMGIASAATSGFGASLLAFVGGPIGAAILAIGVLVAAYVTLERAEEDRRRQFAAGIAEIQAATAATKDLHKALSDVAAFKFPPLSEAAKQYTADLDLIKRKTDELSAARTRLAELESRIQYAMSSHNDAAGIQLLSLVPKADRAKEEVAKLATELEKLRGASTSLGGDLNLRLAPAFDKLTEAITRARDAGTTLQGFQTLIAGAQSFMSQIQGIFSADQQLQTLMSGLNDRQKKITEDMKTVGKTGAQVARGYAEEIRKAAAAANIAPANMAALEKQLQLYIQSAVALDVQKKANENAAKADRDAAHAKEVHADALDRLGDMTKRVTEAQGPYAQALRHLQAAEVLAREEEEKLIKVHKLDQQAKDAIKRLTDAAKASYAQERAELQRRLDVGTRVLKGMNDEIALLRLGAKERQVAEVIARAYNEALQNMTDLHGNEMASREQAIATIRQQLPVFAQLVAAKQEEIRAIEETNAAWEQSKSIVGGALGSFADLIGSALTGGVRTMKDFGKQLLNIAKQMVQQLIAEYLKLKVIKPMMDWIFGGGAGGGGLAMGSGSGTWWGAAVNSVLGGAASGAAGGGANAAGAGGAWGTLVGAGLAYAGGSGGGGGGANQFGAALTSIAGNYVVQNYIMGNGATTLAGNVAAGGIDLSASTGYTLQGNTAAGGVNLASGAGAQGPYGTMGGYGTAAAWGGGILGAYYGATRAGDGQFHNQAGAAVSYGALGMGIAGTAAGVAGGASLGAAAGGAYAAIGSASWIPIVGWILALVAAVDMISGGKVFGTKWKPDTITQSIGIKDQSPYANIHILDKKYGSARFFAAPGDALGRARWRGRDEEPTPEMEAAAAAIFRTASRTMRTASAQLQIEVPPLIEGFWETVTKYTRKGNVKSKEEISTFFGKEYKESFEQFQKRLNAEQIIGAVEAAGGAAHQVAEQWRRDADLLLDGASMLLAAQVDIVRGNALLNDKFTLQSVADLVQANQGGEESLLQTYVRLQQSTMMLEDALAILGQSFNLSRDKFVQFATDIADAAGGVEQARALWSDYFKRFYGEQQLLLRQRDAMQTDVAGQLAGIGLGPNTTLEQFRETFERVLPKLTPQEIAQWLEAGRALGELADVTDQVGAAADLLTASLHQMGIDLGLGADKFEQFAARIADAAGGLDEANKLWTAFFQGFYSESESLAAQVSLMRETVGAQLEGLGLDAGISLADFREAFENALPNLSPEQIVQWLQAGQGLLQLTQSIARLNAIDPARVGQLPSAFQQAMLQIVTSTNAATAAARRQGASEAVLGLIHMNAARQIQAAINVLRAETRDLISQLYGGRPGTVSEAERRIQEIEQQATNSAGQVGNAINSVMSAWKQGLERIQEFLDSMLLNQQVTTLTPEQQLAEAQRQFQAALIAAQGGDAAALGRLPELAQQLLTLGRGFYSSGDQYTALFNMVRSALQGLPNGPAGQTTTTVVASPQLQQLYADRDALLREQEIAHRAELAAQLAVHLRDLSAAIGVPVLQLAQSMGVELSRLATDLGIDLHNITGASVMAMGDMARMLGISLADLTTGLGLSLTDLGGGLLDLTQQLGIDLTNLTGAQVQSLADLARGLGLSLEDMTTGLGLNLTDLAGGIGQMAQQMGINLGNMTVASTQALATLAARLGTDLGTLTRSLGIDLGNLADRQSLLNQALAGTINTLPTAQRDALRPLLAAIENATTEADANAAITALRAAVNVLSPEIRDRLAPFFQNLEPSAGDADVRAIQQSNSWLQDILREIKDTNRILRGQPAGGGGTSSTASLPSYDVGSAYVPDDQVAQIHRGEIVVDPQSASALRRYGIGMTARVEMTTDAATIAALRRIADQADEDADDTKALLRAVVDRLERMERAQSQANQIAQRAQDAALLGRR